MKISIAILFTVCAGLLSPSLATNVDTNNIRRRAKAGKGAKGMKGSKSGKASKSGSDALAAVFEDTTAFGSASVRYNMDGSFLVALDLNKLGASSTGQAVITEGTSCVSPNLTPFTSEDTWDGTVNAFTALDEGITKNAFRFNNGKTLEENRGKTLLLKDSTNTVVGCAVLEEKSTDKILKAQMGTYPGYTGDLTPMGTVKVMFNHDDTFRFQYDFSGLPLNCDECGVHIHEGVSCATATEVKGHGFNSVLVQDLWTAPGGSFYNSNANGEAYGYFHLTNGYGYEENVNHAVVIHQKDGARIACGILE